ALQGAMDDVRIYNIALGAADILELATLPPPPIPLLNSPENLSTAVPTAPELTWNPAQGAGSYQLQVSQEEGFSTTVFDQAGISAISAGISGLQFNTLYYWRVRAANPSGE